MRQVTSLDESQRHAGIRLTYGDWHDIICLGCKTGDVVLLNDERVVVQRWNSVKSFEDSLSWQVEQPRSYDTGIVEASLDF